jgi:hypothetical protein
VVVFAGSGKWKLTFQPSWTDPCSRNGSRLTAQWVPILYVVYGGGLTTWQIGSHSWTLMWLWTARAICLRLLVHCERLAASRAACTAGSSSETRTAIIAMTTSSSISVKAAREGRRGEGCG